MPGAGRRGLRQDVRHRPTRRAVGVEPRRAALPFHAARARARRRSSRPRLGAWRSGTSANARCSRSTTIGVTRRQAEWDSRWWSPILDAEHLAAARPGRHGRPEPAFAIFDIAGPGALAVRTSSSARWTCRSAGWSYTPSCSPGRPDQGRPHHHAPGEESVRAPAVVVRPATCAMVDRLADGIGPALPTYDRMGRRSACGARGPARSSRRSPATTSRTTGSVRDLPRRGDRQPARAGARGSPTSATWAGSSTSRSSRARGSGTSSGRPAGRTASSPVGIGVYGTTGRLEKCYRAYGFELESEYNVVEAGMARPQGQGRRLRRAATPTCATASEDPATIAVHADRRRPHVDERRQALHARARADPDARRRAAGRRAGAAVVRDERRRGAVGRKAPAHGLPAPEHAVVGARAAVEYLGERYPVTVAAAGPRRSSTPTTRGSAPSGAQHPLLREARPDDRRADRPHRRRAGDRDPPPGIHDQPARGVRGRAGRASDRGERRLLDRPHARPARGRGAAARLHGARHRPGDPCSADDEIHGQATAGAILEAIAAERAAGTVRPRSSSATSRPTPATTRSGSAWPTPSPGRA